MNSDLVCEGGGIKGIGLIGAISFLQEIGYDFQRIAGTSAGAIIASLIAVGYTANELKELVFNINFEEFKDKTNLSKIPLSGPFISMLKDKGIYKGDILESFLEEKFKAKGKTKFKDIAIYNEIKNKYESPLKIIVSDLTKKEIVVLPDDLLKYNIDFLDFSISKAVRISLSFPFAFTPVIMEYADKYNNHHSSFLVDGGITSNFPVWLFDVEGIPRWPTFGLKLKSDSENNIIEAKDTNFLNFLFNLIDTVLSCNDEAYLNNKDSVRTINIPTGNIGTLDFSISQKEKEFLFNSGYNAAKKFIETWNFNTYVENYRT